MARRIETQVAVLGAGPGGYTAAFRAADLGLSVVLVERHRALGGVCLNVGCIPSKALLHVAEVIEKAEALAAMGVDFPRPSLDLARMREGRDAVVDRLTGGLAQMAGKRGVEVLRGDGRFGSPHELLVEQDGETTTVAFEHAIVAAGSRPVELPFLPDDDPRVMDSTGALALEEIPRRLLVIGGGIIGLEMAAVYHALGSAVTVVELTEQLIPGCDRALVRPLERRISKQYAAVHTGTRLTALKPQNNGLKASFDGPKAPASGLFDRALVAVGRRPNGDQVGADAAGLVVDERGFVSHDDTGRTPVPHIFAIGDVAGEPMLAHKATHEAKVAVETIAGHTSAWLDRVVPAVAYTDPEIAWVGLTEGDAADQGREVEIASFPWAANGRSLTLHRNEGLTRLVLEPGSGRVLGGGIVGPGAGELIAEVALAVEMRADAEDLALTVHPHPTRSESVGMAAEVFEGSVTDILPPRR